MRPRIAELGYELGLTFRQYFPVVLTLRLDPTCLTYGVSSPKDRFNRRSVLTWRERVGIEPTSRLATTSAILKTVRATRPVRSHDDEKGRVFADASRTPSRGDALYHLAAAPGPLARVDREGPALRHG
jgi:hypothetical protein